MDEQNATSLVDLSEPASATSHWRFRHPPFRLQAVNEIYGGPMFFELAAAGDVLRWYRDFIANAPEQFGGSRHPTSRWLLTDRRGHDLGMGLEQP